MNRNLSAGQTTGMFARRGEVKGAQYLREGLQLVSGQKIQQPVGPSDNVTKQQGASYG
jgi:hypothetical protein